jgi:hypothetical protein
MPHPLHQETPGRAAALWRLAGFSLLILFGMLLLEVLLVALMTGQFPNRITSTLLANPGFFATYLLEAPGTTLRLLLIDKPLFEIAAVQAHGELDSWRLHYFNHAILIHVGLAVVLVRRRHSVRDAGKQGRLQLGAGVVLLASSSLHLFHIGCCTGTPLWIIHTGLTLWLFNPVTSTVVMLDVYNVLQPWLGWLQAGFAFAGGLLIWKSLTPDAARQGLTR